MIEDLVRRTRSYRRFFESEKVGLDVLRGLVDLTRYCPSAANLQPLKYRLVCEPKENAVVYENLAWAGYLKGWGGPVEGERPSAYIIVLADPDIRKPYDHDAAIAAYAILLAATEKGLGGCMLASVKREELKNALDLPAELEITLVVAIGKPKEKIVIESVGADGDIKYWRDGEGIHHVPKRSLDDIIV